MNSFLKTKNCTILIFFFYNVILHIFQCEINGDYLSKSSMVLVFCSFLFCFSSIVKFDHQIFFSCMVALLCVRNIIMYFIHLSCSHLAASIGMWVWSKQKFSFFGGNTRIEYAWSLSVSKYLSKLVSVLVCYSHCNQMRMKHTTLSRIHTLAHTHTYTAMNDDSNRKIAHTEKWLNTIRSWIEQHYF